MKPFYSLCGLCAVIVLMAFNGNAQSTYYVKASATGTNNGSSWSNAFTNLQSALDAATSGDQIWVAAGTYVPSKDALGNASPTDNRTKTFLLKNGVKLYGGFNGTESSLSSRQASANITLLSGDLDGNDANDTFLNNGNNAYHVVVANALTTATVFDGFTLKAGNANVTQDFVGVTWGNQYGSGMLVSQVGSNLTVSNCVFTFNYAGYGGAGLHFVNGTPKIQSCVFYYNYTNGYGGGLHLYYNASSGVIVNCVFAGNSSNYQAGGIYNWGTSTTIANCTFSGNYASHEGGGIHNRTYAPTIVNTIIWGNTGGGSQGISNENTTATVTYSNIQGGYAGTGNFDSDPIFDKPSDPDGPDNLWRTSDDGLIVRTGSYTINFGSNAAVPAGITTDITGNARLQGNVNMGAYESQKPNVTYYVNTNATGNNSGTSWANAFTDIQSALEVSLQGDEIWVAKGTYKPTKDSDGNFPSEPRRKTFMLRNGVKLYGGFAGNETSISDRVTTLNPTVLTGDLNSDDESNMTNRADNAYHVVAATNLTKNTTLDGFTITGGYADVTESFIDIIWGNHEGGGIILSDSYNLTINNCSIQDNFGGYGGGGFYFYNSQVTITNSVFAYNSCSNSYGGGGYTDHSVVNYTNSVFSSNQSNYQGGGLFIFNGSTATIVNCTFNDNHSLYEGGALYSEGATVWIKNSIIWNNLGKGDKGIAANHINNITVSYSTIEGGFTGTNNLSDDPKFSNFADPDGFDNIWLTNDDGLVLLTGSSAINTGSNAAIPAGINTDIAGNNRIINSTVNPGAYESERASAGISIPSGTYTYDGTARTFTATTNPQGLNTVVRYRRTDNFQYVDAPVNAGVYQAIAAINDANYGGTAVGTITINKAAGTIELSDLIQTYDGTAKSPAVVVTPATEDYYFDFYTSDDEYIDYAIDAGTYTVVATLWSKNYEASVTKTFTINKAEVNIGLTNLTQTYDGNVKTVGIAADEQFLNDVQITYSQGDVEGVTPITAGTYTVKASLSTSNYFGNTTGTLTIGKANQNISFDELGDKTFGDASFDVQATSSTGLPVAFSSSDPSVATVSGNTVTIVGGGSVKIIAIQDGNQNYALARVEQTLVVHKKAQNISFGSLTDKTFGDPAFTLEASSSSSLPIVFSSSNTSIVVIDGATATIVGAGTVTIIALQSGNTNYAEATPVTQTFTVAKKIQSITFDALPDRIYGEAPFALNATASSSLAVRYSSSNESVAVVNGNMITLRGDGETLITAYQDGNNGFAAAAPVTQKLVVKLITGIESTSAPLVKVYPNPTTDYITVESSGSENRYVMIDSYGKVVMSASYSASENQTLTIDVRDLATGIYYLKAMQGATSTTTRIIKK